MDASEIRNRLQEIRDEAAKLNDEPNAETLEKLRELVAERKQLKIELETLELTEEATSEVPEAEAEADASAEATGGDPTEEADADAEATSETPDATDGDGAGDDADAAGDADADSGDTPDDAEAGGDASADVGEAIAAAGVRDTPTGAGGSSFRPRLVASAKVENVSPGKQLETTDFHRIAQAAFSSRYDGRNIFAGIRRWEPGSEALSGRNSAIANTRLMHGDSGKQQPLTAAACFCGPDEAVKDIAVCGTEGRPVAGLFRSSPVNGRFNYVKPVPLSVTEAGVTTWTCADQEAIDPGNTATHKPCVDLDCQAEVEVEPYLLPTCGRVTTHQQLSHPELVDDFIRRLAIAHDRNAEQELLDTIRAQSTVYTFSSAQGILSNLEHILAQLQDVTAFGNRITLEGYTLLVPIGTIEKIVADQHLRGAQQCLRTQAVLDCLSDLGISDIVEIHEPDSTAAAAYAAAVAGQPADGVSTPYDPDLHSVQTIPFYLLNPDAFRHGSSEIVEAGFIRDSNLAKQNSVEWFFEGAEFLEKVNCHPSYVLEITACPTGEASQMVAGPPCTTP